MYTLKIVIFRKKVTNNNNNTCNIFYFIIQIRDNFTQMQMKFY